jgi:hypothetical protein
MTAQIISKKTPADFVMSVADNLAEIADAARAADPKHNGELRQTSSLDIVARYIRGRALLAGTLDTDMRYLHPQARPITDPRFYSLYVAGGEAMRYEPGRWQRGLLRDLSADFGGYQDPGEMLSELACRAIRDRELEVKAAEQDFEARSAELLERAARGEALRAPLDAANARVTRLAAENGQLRAELDEANRQLEEERERTAVLWGQQTAVLWEEAKQAETSPAVDTRTRRTKVDGEVGIYLTSGGQYEIGYKDGVGGPQRWEIVGDDLEQARAVRAERVAEAKAAVPS